MDTILGIRGLLLEEALQYLLRVSGYRTIEDYRIDPEVLRQGKSGLEVYGRGGSPDRRDCRLHYISSIFKSTEIIS